MNALAIFPENGLANSVIPPVFIGLGLSTFFAETLGWNFSGLIVPGYLAPILIVKPFSGLVIIVEALISYIILRLLSDGCSRMGIWTSFFGQDAFFALFCISILVKSALEGPLLPGIGEMLVSHFHLSIDYHNELHSTGLIVVPLMANIFWRHGFRRNIFPVFATVALTYFITRYILVPYTNFSVNRFELLYSKMATDFMESPRFYLILLIGTALASHNRYRYGWAYHGMLIPALMGIAWLTPIKVLTTFLESGLILIIATLITQRKFMKNISMEGPRKLFFLFSIGFVLKMLLGFTFQSMIPGYPVSDLYGFAYILPALIAMEMWTKASYLKVTRVTIQTSLAAAVGGLALNVLFQFSSIGDLSLAVQRSNQMSQPVAATASLPFTEVRSDFGRWVRLQLEDRIRFGANHVQIPISDLQDFDRRVLTPIIRHLNRFSILTEEKLDRIQQQAIACGYSINRLIDESTRREYIIFLEPGRPDYHGVYILRSDYAQPYVIEVPNPMVELYTVDAGIELFHSLDARALLISGTSRRKEYAEFDVTHMQFRQSMFQLFHQVIHREFVETEPQTALQIRGASDIRADSDVLISFGGETVNEYDLSSSRLNLVRHLRNLGLKISLFQGTPDQLSYASRSNIQFSYIDTFKMGDFAALWMSPKIRSSYADPAIPAEIIQSIDARTVTGDFKQWVDLHFNTAGSRKPSPDSQALFESVREEMKLWELSGNIIHLTRISEKARNCKYEIIDFEDYSRNFRCIILYPIHESLPVMIFPYHSNSEDVIHLAQDTPMRNNVLDMFLTSRVSGIILAGDGI